MVSLHRYVYLLPLKSQPYLTCVLQAPLLDTYPGSAPIATPIIEQIIPKSFRQGYSTVIIGGHSTHCRWYSEDAVTVGDNIKVQR